MNPVVVLTCVLLSVLPSGFRMEPYSDHCANVEFVNSKLVDSPAVPLNVSLTFCPGVVVVTVTGVPGVGTGHIAHIVEIERQTAGIGGAVADH
jgi:hypothetical protein